MPSDVIVTPEILAGQSAEMSSLMAEYESLFTSVSSLLTEINGSWSPNMANNFSGKIQSAQKSFSNVVGMLGNGASAAKAASQIYADDLAGAAGGKCNTSLLFTGRRAGRWKNAWASLFSDG